MGYECTKYGEKAQDYVGRWTAVFALFNRRIMLPHSWLFYSEQLIVFVVSSC